MAEPTTVSYGILGCAERAKKVAKAILQAPNSSLGAIGSRSIDKAKDYAQANEFPPSTKVYGSYDEVLDDPDIDAVYIPLPTGLRLHWVVKAAEKKKHVLLEKPVAFTVEELDKILSACECNGVQFMDGTMWLHHPRTTSMEEFLRDPLRFGQLKEIQSTLTWKVDENFLKNDIRVKPELDGLGALGDAGWYCIGASLLATDYELPKYVTAQNNAVKNEAGVILSCEASLHWDDGRSGNFRCSFISDWSMGMTATGTNGTLYVMDYVIPFKTDVASYTTKLPGNSTETEPKEESVTHIVKNELPQEALMIKEFSSLVDGIKRLGLPTEKKWQTISRKIHIVIDAVLASIDRGGEKVEVP
ncbi:hypothetical protein RND81_01G155400 [Saponaria officinalis]|uniref:Gfo/Idh/MocA-like oxidoreductase N-terminal domain-containing protein n=1 Tax=Saponaria officinalis TaxID=3572 RepID=A0AAW1NA49_SAPOF